MATITRSTGSSRFLAITFDIEGEKQVAAGFDFVGKELKSLKKPLKKASEKFVRAIDTQFDSEGGEFGTKWQQLSPKYASWKAAKYPGKGILQRTGKMRKSFKTKIAPLSATIFNPTFYFKFHQSNTARRGKLPRRVMMQIDRRRQDMILREFTIYLNEVRGHFSKNRIQ
jgi:phage gpG-like protein